MLFQRILTVVIAGPFVIGTILCPATIVFKVLCLLCLILGLREFLTIVGHPPVEKNAALFLGAGYMVSLLFGVTSRVLPLGDMSLLILVAFAFYCLYPAPNRAGIAVHIALTVLGILYVGTFGSFVARLRDLPDGAYWVFTLLGMTWLNDTSAYFFGHHLGRHRLAPLISPGKTVEGFLGGFLGSFLGFVLFWKMMANPLTLRDGLILTVLVGFLGPLGDLSESLIKRSFGVKDSGNIIPGHGGMLDRIDALLFTAPVVYWFAYLKNFS